MEIFFEYIDSFVGKWKIRANENGVIALDYLGHISTKNIYPNQHTQRAKTQLIQYFSKERTDFDLELDFEGATDFYQSVWHKVAAIPYGKTKSYLDVAKAINNPKAVRAVGMANGKNPIPIIIPCHRVIASSGKLQGYAHGLSMKKALLTLENPKRYPEQLSLF